MKPPTFPRTHTLKARALCMLLKAYALTHLDFQGKTASYRLSASIWELRHKYGWLIETKKVPTKTADGSRLVIYGRYSITPENLVEYRKLIGKERIDAFIEAAAPRKKKGGN